MPISSSANPSSRPVIWTVAVSRLSTLLRDVTPEFDAQAQIEPITLGFEEAVTEINARLTRQPCDVLIAAGSNGAYLRHRVPCPVVLIRPSGFDLMQALTQARRLSPHIGVITHQSEIPMFSAFQESFGLQIEQRAFVTAEEARHAVAELSALGVRVVIGTGSVVDYAEQMGIAGILLYSTDSVRDAFESAIDLTRDLARMLAQSQEFTPGGRELGVAHGGRAKRLAGSSSGTHAGHNVGGGNTAHHASEWIGHSAASKQLREQIALCAASDATVLIQGETGSGKEVVARNLHRYSARRGGPFIPVNCGALTDSLLESELFGYEDGAFTGARRGGKAGWVESADGGTLFLDEIGEMPLALQTRLLRVLEQREIARVGGTRLIPVDIRVIAATHCQLADAVKSGRFRQDLFYRLNVLNLQVPALRERIDDIPQLLELWLRAEGQSAKPLLSAELIAALSAYSWPGNVRELRNFLQRMVALSKGAVRGAAPLDWASLKLWLPELKQAPPGLLENSAVENPLVQGRRGAPANIQQLLAQMNGDRAALCAHLGISRTTLWRWLQQKPPPAP